MVNPTPQLFDNSQESTPNQYRNYSFIQKWISRLRPFSRLNLFAILVGIISGLAAWLFHTLISGVFFLFYDGPQTLLTRLNVPFLFWIVLLFGPGIGGALVGVINTHIPKEAQGHGVPEIISAIMWKDGQIPTSVPFIKMITATITLGTGGSGGAEGPIAQIGGGIGSIIAQKTHLMPEEMKVLVIAGVAAGIGAVFNAPIAGALFAIEAIKRQSDIRSLAPLIIASVVGTITGRFLLGQAPKFELTYVVSYSNPALIPLYIILGSICGVFAAVWIKFFHMMERQQKRIYTRWRIPSSLHPAIGGILVGIISMVIYFLAGDQWKNYTIMGATYAPLNAIFSNSYLSNPFYLNLLLFFVLFLAKMVATALSLGSGGAAGLLAPTIFLGVMVGSFAGQLFVALFHLTANELMIFAIVGMAAFFAGTFRAPFTAIMITVELTSDFLVTIPLMFAVAISWFIAEKIEHEDLYSKKLVEMGIQFPQKVFNVLEVIKVKEKMVPSQKVLKIDAHNTLDSVLEAVATSGHQGFPVMKENTIFGVITIRDILGINRNKLPSTTVEDFLKIQPNRNLITIDQDATLQQALAIMNFYHISRLPVIDVDPSGSPLLLGWLTQADFERAYAESYAASLPREVASHVMVFHF